MIIYSKKKKGEKEICCMQHLSKTNTIFRLIVLYLENIVYKLVIRSRIIVIMHGFLITSLLVLNYMLFSSHVFINEGIKLFGLRNTTNAHCI